MLGENTQLQIVREGNGQLYSPSARPPSTSIFNSLLVRHGTQFHASVSSLTNTMSGRGTFENVSQSAVTGTGASGDPWTVETVVRTTSGITLTQVVSYVLPEQYATFAVTVSAPATNTDDVRLYHYMDTYLGGSDSGPAYVDDPVAPTVVGVSRGTVFEAFVQFTDPWDRYHSGNYYEGFTALAAAGDLSNTLDTSLRDNGIGVQWNLGALQGERTIRYLLAFTAVDFRALDQDADGVFDIVEGYSRDTDDDDILDYLDSDDDGDRILTRDEDADGDGRPTSDDADRDGVPDYLETDADGGCTPDGDERDVGSDPWAAGDDPDDHDRDGVCDAFDLCLGDDATGDLDLDLVCADLERCWIDDDGDGYRDNGDTFVPDDERCDGPGELEIEEGAPLDCDPTLGDVYPGADELPGDGVDADCDTEELCFVDADFDGVGGADEAPSASLACDDAGLSAATGDCDEADPAVRPGVGEGPADGVDADCDGLEACFIDGDGDGFGRDEVVLSLSLACEGEGVSAADTDCDDAAASTAPGAAEIPGDGVDQDCDGLALCFVDVDLDGWRTEAEVLSADGDCADPGEAVASAPSGDCDDFAPGTYPTAADIPNDSFDQDCDGDDLGRSCFVDGDGDGWRTDDTALSVDEDCADPGEADAATPSGDCDDAAAGTYPTAAETPNDAIDQDCDGDDLGRSCFVDADGDGWRTDETALSADEDCADAGEADASAPSGDCDDAAAGTYPTATETPNDAIDEDCDGDDLGRSCFVDGDGDGWRTDETALSVDEDCDDVGEADASAPSGDCDDAAAGTYPTAAETPNDSIDQDCDGDDLGRSCFVDADGDGWRTEEAALSVDEDCADAGEADASAPSGDCDDGDPDAHPTAAEPLGFERDCDGRVACFTDADGDGWRRDVELASDDADCDDPGEAPADAPGPDCDDASVDVYPGATEIPADGLDQDCDGGDDTIACAPDADGDGARGPGALPSTDPDCDDPGEAAPDAPEDCDDGDAGVAPGAAEVADDGVDQDCDGGDVCFADADGDGLRADGDPIASADLDCDDAGEAVAAAGADCDDSAADADADGLPDADEADRGTGACDADTDDDGLDDGAEVAAGTDPAATDSDGGGVADGDEVDAGSDPLDPDDDLGETDVTDVTDLDKPEAGCDCAAAPSGAGASLWLGALGLLAARRRRAA